MARKTATPNPSALVTMLVELAADGVICAKAPKWIAGIKSDLSKTPEVHIIKRGVLQFVLECLNEATILCECTPVVAAVVPPAAGVPPAAPVAKQETAIAPEVAATTPEVATPEPSTPEAPAPEPTTPETPAATA